MYVEFFHWHIIVAPRWLLALIWNLERAIIQFFSVPYMLRTLPAHWRRDAVSYQGGAITQYFITFAWNLISRAIGFIIRTAVLIMWLIIEIMFVLFAFSIFFLFLLWPLLVVGTIATGLALLLLV